MELELDYIQNHHVNNIVNHNRQFDPSRVLEQFDTNSTVSAAFIGYKRTVG
jgi:hypothetical protein